jgi:hypothetical protein
LFCEHLDVYSETWPTSGFISNGVAYALPTWEPATDVSASSSLLLTPVASEGEKATFQQGSAQRALTGQPFLTNQIRDVYELNTKLLPTPEAKLGSSVPDYAKAARGSGGNDLQTTVSLNLLPTPKASDGAKGGPNQRGSSGDLTMPSAAVKIFQTPSVADALGGHERRGGKRGQELLLNGEVKALYGATMSPPSSDGSEPSDDQLPGQLNLLDAIADTV